MGSFYLDIIKDRQYTTKRGSLAHRSCQTALYYIVEALVRWIAPVLSFTADEIWNQMPGERDKFVFTGNWYEDLFGLDESKPMNSNYWQKIQDVRTEVNKVLETARSSKEIGGALQAEVTLYATEDLAAELSLLQDELRFVLITSKADVVVVTTKPENAHATEIDGLWVAVTASKAPKCVRCWHHVADVGTNSESPEICGRCITNIEGDGEMRKFA